MPLHHRQSLSCLHRCAYYETRPKRISWPNDHHGARWEFAFVLFSAATTAGVMTKDQNATFTAAVIISMLFSPLIGLLMRKINQRKSTNQEEKVDTSDLDPIVDLEDSVLVIGFGRFSQIVCQSLLVRGINVSVIDRNIENIRAAAKFGFKVYYGDGIRLDVLREAAHEKRTKTRCA